MSETTPPKKTGRGGARAGSGQKRFEPTEQQRQFVKLGVAFGIPLEKICLAVINPKTKEPIGRDVMARSFKREIEIAQVEMDTIVGNALAKKITEGNMTAIIWYQKNRMGWRDNPTSATEANQGTGAAAVKHIIEIEGGLPMGSTPDDPGGPNYSEVPPEETHE